MKVVVEKVPVKHPRPFKAGDIVKSKSGEYYYLLLEATGTENVWRYVCLSPINRDGVPSVNLLSGNIIAPDSYELYSGVITLSNEG